MGTPSTHLTIIGGGISGIGTLVHAVGRLAEQNISDVTIHLIDPSASVGGGMVYSENLPDNILLNHENNLMGCVNHQKINTPDLQDFFTWMKEHQTEIKKRLPDFDPTNPMGYAPRNLYGQYLHSRYEEAKTFAAQHGITIDEIKGYATQVTPHEGGWEVSYERDGGHYSLTSSQLVLASGHWSRALPKTWAETGKAFTAYPPDAYTQIPGTESSQSLLIRGTGLTAVDAAISALDSGKYAHVTMVSRRGQLHAVRGKTTPYEPKHLTKAALEPHRTPEGYIPLEVVIDLFAKELKSAYEAHGKPFPNPEDILRPKSMERFLEQQLADSASGEPLIWRSVIEAIDSRDGTRRAHLYPQLSPEDRTLFLNEFNSIYTAYRAPMPDVNAKKLLHYLKSG